MKPLECHSDSDKSIGELQEDNAGRLIERRR